MAINTWAVSLMRYGAGILKRNKNELQQIDRKTRKVMTINKELHPRSDVKNSKEVLLKKVGEISLVNIEEAVEPSEYK